ncbi:RHS repeat-associated core domain-containing protein [Streptomyces sp. NPDC006691]|uniref:RHS repeat-associated core domain-containing protein n=1 Tax=Streptomyces sp. NPDC006691 TaxID=3364757 RepID=UPI0036BA78FA
MTKLSLPELQKTKPVPVTPVDARPATTENEAAKKAWKQVPDATWPRAGTAKARLDGRTGAKTLTAGALPVTIAPAAGKAPGTAAPASGDVAVEVLDRATAAKAGVDGVVFAVDTSGGGADLTVDYTKFRNALGGDWSTRLTLAQLPDCALSTPGAPSCRPVPLTDVDNDPVKGALSAPVALAAGAGAGNATPKPSASPSQAPSAARGSTPSAAAPGNAPTARTLFAVTAAPAGGGGDFRATSLSPSGTWAAGGSSGGFTWSYDLQTPDVAGDVGPDLSLGYSSSSVDGRTSASNNQANNVGDGWGMEPGFIERRYKACNADMTGGNNKAKNGDLCWGGENAVLSLGGKTNELVRDDTSGVWKLRNDDGSKVEKLTDTGRGNGDHDGEYWKVTDTDGVQYFFGYHRLPGYSDGKQTTDSTWTVPVYGNHAGEPCHKTSFADSWCQQAWRWNLDYVVDPHGDAMAYYWAKETNHYGRNVSLTDGKSTATPYTRGGYLKRIEYGLRSNNLYTGIPGAKVTFTTAERCLATGSFDCAENKFTAANAAQWPDVPFDQYCAAGTDCKNRYSPSFWSRKRITDITTEVREGSAYKKVDSWKLTHQFPSTGDGSSPALWLASIQRTGHTGGTPASLPAVTFMGTQLENRVDKTGDGIPPLIRYRVYAVDNESGGRIGVTYSAPECTATTLPPDSAANTKRCYSVFWASPDNPGSEFEPKRDWFNTYVVTQVREEDNVGGAPPKQTSYTYSGGAAWAKSEDEFTQDKYRTYSDFRGYQLVKSEVGNGNDGPKLHTEKRYFRGINGAKVPDSEGNETADHPAFAGTGRDEATFNGTTLTGASASIPWKSAPTATHKRTGLPDLQAFRVAPAQSETTRTAIESGWRRTKMERTFDTHGMVSTESDLGDTAKSGDETCTSTSYARNTATNIQAASAVKTVAAACGTAPNLPTDLISEKRTYFDGSTTLGAPPAKGDVTRVDEQDAAGIGFVTVETNKVDQHGRTVETMDAAGAKTTTAYTPAANDAPVKTVVTNALGHHETTEQESGRGQTTAKVDANGKRTDATFDGLGRVSKVWQPGWPKTANPDTPSQQFMYTVARNTPTVVATQTLRYTGEYRTEYAFFDGLLRDRETQIPSGNGTGRVIAEKKYDSRGLEWKTYQPYYATSDPSGTLVTGDDTKSPHTVRTTFDGAARPTAQISEKYGAEASRITTRYGGDRVTVIPPKGDTATTTVTDVRDRTSELIQYTNDQRTASQSTKYTYTPSGQQKAVTDPTGATWTYTYDHRDRAIETYDPDKGLLKAAYDSADRPITSTDANGTTLTTVYDALGRKTALKNGSTVLSSWTYDTVAKGQLAKSVRHDGGQDYTAETTGLNDRYQPTATKVTIPAREGGLAGTYEWTYGYNARTGALDWTFHPAIAGQLKERVTHRYATDSPYDQVVGTNATGAVLVNNVTYDPFQRPLRTEYGPFGKKVWDTREYDEHTGNLTRQTTDRETGPARIDDIRYTFDQANNITKLETASGQDAQRSVDTQCFTTDALRRITNAWTATDGCTAKPDADGSEGGTAPKVGGPDAYWHAFTYDAVGNRQTETQHKVDGNPLATDDVKRTYLYGQNGAGKRQLTGVTQATAGKTTTDSYAYDEAGNTTKRQANGARQDMSWDAEGHLAKVTKDGQDTEYRYDADGNRILAKNTGGSTLYLPGGNELHATTTGAKTGTRYYTQDTQSIAIKTRGEMSILLSDHHGTATTAVLLATGQALTRRKKTVFGGDRTAQPATWPGTKGFVGGTQDPTGLTHLGAREYDPHLGRFISVDPVIDTADPQQMHGYTYGNNNPLIHSDPDGKLFGGNNSSLWLRPGAKDPYANSGPWSPAEYERRNNQNRQRSNPNYSPYKTSQGVKRTSYQNHGPWSPKVYKQRKADADAAARAKKAAEDKKRKHDAAMKESTRDKRSAWQKIKDGAGKAWKNTLGDHWRGIAEGAAFGVCVVASVGACAVAGAVVVAGKFGADWYTHDFGYAADRGKGNTQGYLIGLGLGAAGGKAWAHAAKMNGVGRSLPQGRHAAGVPRHASGLRVDRWFQGLTYGVNTGLGQAGCGTTMNAPGWC